MSIDLESMTEMHIEPQEIAWLWRPYLAAGKLTLLDGDPGAGKSLITIDIAARLSRGGAMPDGSPGPGPATSLIINPEDNPADTLAPRLISAGADLSRILLPRLRNGFERLQFPRDLQAIESLIASRRVALVVIDPLSAIIPDNLPLTDLGAVRCTVAPLAMLAARSGVAIILVRHLTKRVTDSDLRRGQGSMNLIGLARTGLFVAHSPHHAELRQLSISKTNLSSPPDPLVFRLATRDRSVMVDWLGSAVGQTGGSARPTRRPESPGIVQATLWLLDAMANGPRLAAELLVAARADGIKEAALERAKRSLGIWSEFKMIEGKRAWLWHPAESPSACGLEPLDFELEPLPYQTVDDLPAELTDAAKKIQDREKLAWASKHYRPQR